jgi:hypothetical protein
VVKNSPSYKKQLLSLRIRATGMTKELWDVAWDRQRGCCAICCIDLTSIHTTKSHGIKMCADHDHVRKVPRGILCSPCNQGIGLLKDRSDFCRAAADYLDYHLLKELL